ncbi:MAG: hypothetical protein ABIT83_04465 [Massilia sp.]
MTEAELAEVLGVACECIDDEHGVFELDTGLSFSDDDPIPAFVQRAGDRLCFFDDQEVMTHFMSRFIEIEEAAYPALIAAIVGSHGVTVGEPDELEMWTTLDDAAEGFKRYRMAMQELAQWEDAQLPAWSRDLVFTGEAPPDANALTPPRSPY